MIRIYPALLFAPFIIAGCSNTSLTPRDRDVRDAIALCSSGVELTQSATAKLTSDITEILGSSEPGEASVEISSAIRGIAFTEEGLKDENVLNAFKTYNACIQSGLSEYLQ